MVARNIDLLLGVTYQHVSRFKSIGISNTLELLDAANSAQAQRSLARSLSITSRQMQRWVCSADLLRIRGLSTHYANLLIEVGVCTSDTLATADIDLLLIKMQQINSRKRFVKRLPAHSQILQWQKDARLLPTAQ